MSLTQLYVSEGTQRFPRVSGDEPDQRAIRRGHRVFSPRERG